MFKKLNQKDQKFYNTVAEMIKRINTNRSTAKTEIFNSSEPEKFYGILHKVLINYNVLKIVNKKSDFMKNVPLGCVLICETLNGNLHNTKYKKIFTKALGTRELKNGEDIVFIRLIKNKANEEDLKEYVYEKTPINGVYKITGLKDENAKINVKKHVVTNLMDRIKIQSFESCLPVHFLNPEKDSTVIDATAAPGNKTTQCYDAMEGTGKIFAFEMDEGRCKTLNKMIEEYGCDNVTVENKDFLTVDPEEIKPDYMIVDPSCSGSGIHFNYRKSDKRLVKLKNFQCMILNHALSFGAKKVVYSTCSVHEEEGEEVVKEALEKNEDYTLEKIELEGTNCGNENYEFADKVVRVEKEQGIKSGFFVALFVKK